MTFFSDRNNTAADRVSDLAVLLGHVMQCEMCRDRLLEAPERATMGRKMTTEQRHLITRLTPEDFENTEILAAAMGISASELNEGINHPRARLRHL